jgi:glycosidase
MQLQHWTSGIVAAWALSCAGCGGTGEIAADGRTRSDVAAVDVAARSDVGRGELVAADALPPACLRDEVVYYVMPDRFSNGSKRNDRGDYAVVDGVDPAAPTEIAKHGFDPTRATFYHGGDIAGLRRKLDYIRGLGASAIWTTPLLRSLTMARDGSQAGYHGYWPIGFDEVDPHLGTAADVGAYVDAAHRKGIKVFFDILINHTADVIDYVECSSPAGCPFRTAPPYTPLVPPGLEAIKTPAWLNDTANYNNLGTLTFSPESMVIGDLGGLDDFKTSDEGVASGIIDIYRGWLAKYDIDGFRLDAARHVDDAFLRRFWTETNSAAKPNGQKDFFAFGEVHDGSSERLAHFTAGVGLPSVQDFHFFYTARDVFSRGRPTDYLRGLFDDDDSYVSTQSHAGYLVTHLSTHDDGRFGAFLVQDNPAASDAELLARDTLAHALLLTARGIPAVYYGDEQGFTGIDKNGYTSFEAARQDMFPSAVPAYGTPGGGVPGDHTYNKQIGAASTPATDNFDERHPLYRSVHALSALRDSIVELRRGYQIHRYSDGAEGGGLFAFSRILPGRNREVLVIFNTSASEQKSATIRTLHPSTPFRARYAVPRTFGGGSIASDADGRLAVTLPPLGFQVLEAAQPLPRRRKAPGIVIGSPESQIGLGRFWVTASLSEPTCAKVRFFAKEPGATAFRDLGADENPPYRVPYDGTALPLRSIVSFRAVVTDCWGNERASAEVPIVTENRLHDVTVHYQNGHGRTSFFSLLADGRIGLPAAVVPSGNTFRWPDGADRVTLFFETPSSDGRTYAFDRPIVVRREDVGNFGRLSPDGIDADLYLDNAGQVAGAPHDVAELPPTMGADPSQADPIGVPIFLRGDMNGWTTSDALAYVGGGTFMGTTTLASSGQAYGFKIADAAWSVEFGAPFELPGGVTPRGSNLRVDIPAGQEGAYRVHFFSFAVPGQSVRTQFYRFEKLAATGPCDVTFSVRAVPELAADQHVYVAGNAAALGPWAPGAQNELTLVDGGGAYTGAIRLDQGTNVAFKFIIVQNGAVTWESHGNADRTLSIPAAPTASYDATWDL